MPVLALGLFAHSKSSHHDGQEGHAVHLGLVDIVASDVEDGRAEVDVCHQHLVTLCIQLNLVQQMLQGTDG